ncbi:MAG: RNA 2',3'-cyclic phosphodiesterase [Elusimicrobiota bacterium]|nr:RNA 2',3'-cyclic phosphodiesterase [Elusimicrobiota bacterium]
MRLFIAVPLPEKVKKKATLLIKKTEKDFFRGENFLCKIKWLKKENMHITLKFLGETGVDPEKIKDALGLSADGVSPEKMELNRPGIFTQKRPRILWLGASRQSKSLRELYESLNVNFAPLGFEIDRRKFIPHLTLGRVKKGRVNKETVKNFLTRKIEPLNFEIDRVSLFESKLTPQGARHNIIYNAELND